MGSQLPLKGAQPPPSFRFMSIVANGWMDEAPLGTKVDLGRGHIVLDGDPAKGAQQPPLYGPFLLWPRSPISAAAELLLQSPAIAIAIAKTVMFWSCYLYFSVQIFDVPGPIFAKLCYTTRHILK